MTRSWKVLATVLVAAFLLQQLYVIVGSGAVVLGWLRSGQSMWPSFDSLVRVDERHRWAIAAGAAVVVGLLALSVVVSVAFRSRAWSRVAALIARTIETKTPRPAYAYLAFSGGIALVLVLSVWIQSRIDLSWRDFDNVGWVPVAYSLTRLFLMLYFAFACLAMGHAIGKIFDRAGPQHRAQLGEFLATRFFMGATAIGLLFTVLGLTGHLQRGVALFFFPRIDRRDPRAIQIHQKCHRRQSVTRA